jgi:hypothetical protein
MMKLIPPPACAGNDLRMLHLGAQALVIDPDVAAAVQAAPGAQGLGLAPILVMHPHAAPRARKEGAGDRFRALVHRRRSRVRVAALPPDTQRGCAPQRRPSNPRPVAVVEAGNRDIGARAAFRARLRPAQPSTIVNAWRREPFLRCNDAAAPVQARERRATGPDPVAAFAACRE